MNRRDLIKAAGVVACLVTGADVVCASQAAEVTPVPEVEPSAQQVSFSWLDGKGDTVACDWRGPYSDGAKWSMTSREYGCLEWYPDGVRRNGKAGQLSEGGRKMLLEHFKLETIADELLLEVIEKMPPAELAHRRRVIEMKTSAGREEILVKCSSGGYVPAEQCA